MNYEITDSNFAPIVKINLKTNEKIKIERGSMVYKNDSTAIEGGLNGKGLFKSIGRALTSGESMLITTATGLSDDAILGIAPSIPGEIVGLTCGAEQWFLNDGSYLASSSTVSYEMIKKSGLGSSLLGGMGGFFNMKTSGSGTVLINSFGNIIEHTLDGSQDFIVDNSHVIAWSTNLNHSLEAASGKIGFTTGEGLAIRFKGMGKVYIQTRQIPSLALEVGKYITTK